jgi:hypothetical protein
MNIEMDKPVKKLTAGAVLKKYNITVDELDQLLDQIYTELENDEDKNEDVNSVVEG